jgi:hypothetical protein
MTPNTTFPIDPRAVEAALARQLSEDDAAHHHNIHTEKWPVWMRLLFIVGLSIALWTGIIWGTMALFG